MTNLPDTFDARLQDQVLYLAARGPLVAGHVHDQRAALKQHLALAEKAVVLDLSEADLVDSLGITLVVGLYKSCVEHNLFFSVSGANPEVLRLFKFFNLNEVFAIREK